MTNHVPGIEMNAMVAEKVLGWSHDPQEPLRRYWWDADGHEVQLLNFSEDLEAAWIILNAIQDNTWFTEGVVLHKPDWGPHVWRVCRHCYEDLESIAEHEDLPMAICLAALELTNVPRRTLPLFFRGQCND